MVQLDRTGGSAAVALCRSGHMARKGAQRQSEIARHPFFPRRCLRPQELERAAAELAEARRLSSDDRFSSIASFANRNAGLPSNRALQETNHLAGLRKAGMPEE